MGVEKTRGGLRESHRVECESVRSRDVEDGRDGEKPAPSDSWNHAAVGFAVVRPRARVCAERE